MFRDVRTIRTFIVVFLFISPISAFAEILSQGENGQIIAKIPGNRIDIYPNGSVTVAGKAYDCDSTTKRSFILGASVFSCSSEEVNLASPAGSFSYSADSGNAQVVLTSGSIEQRDFGRILLGSAREESEAKTDGLDDSEDIDEVTIDSGNVRVETGRNGSKQVQIGDVGSAAESGMNVLGATLGGLAGGASGDKKATQDTQQGFAVIGKGLGGMANGAANTVGVNPGQIDIKSANGTSVKINNGKLEGTSNTGTSWRISTSKTQYDTAQIMQDLKARRSGDQIEFDMADEVLFDFNSSAVKPAASKTLEKIAFLIKEKSIGEVYVEGHTDAIGSDAQNLELSKKRVASVSNWLVEAEGIPATILSAKAFGESKPVAHNTMPDGSDNPDGRAKNRRVSFRFKAQ